ncbi:MAG: STAS domain-containing protein [Clostridiales bacterium]|nr:STAS domain-containing protein [Clostridiales bacterium]
MKISSKVTNGTLYVALYGELDESCATYVRSRLDALFDTPKLTKVVLDMAGVTFMDSTGIGMLIGRYKILKGKNLPLLLSSPSAVVDKLLRLSGIYELMPKINF